MKISYINDKIRIVRTNHFLLKLEKADVNNFTTDNGIKIRRIINKPLRTLIKNFSPGKIIIDSYPKLDPNKRYIFASTHSCVREINALLGCIDRSAYTLCGTTDQFEHNIEIYINWLTGVIYVDRFKDESRKSIQSKEKRILLSGSNYLEFPEGGLNNSENLLIQRLCSGGVYWVPKELKDDVDNNLEVEVVPISVFNALGEKELYLSASEPLKLFEYNKEEATTILRDALATLMWEHFEKHAPRIKRQDLSNDPRLDFMEERRQEYLKVNWTRDVWDEELYMKNDPINPYPNEVRKTFENVKITKDNAYVMAPILSRLEEDNKYNFNRYMHENWNKSKTKIKKRI